MDQKMLFGVGVSAVTLFIRWLFPTIPKPIGWSGISIGVMIIAMSFVTSIRLGPASLAVAGVAMLTAAVAWQYAGNHSPATLTTSSDAFSPSSQAKAKAANIDLNSYPKKVCFDYSTDDGITKLSLNDIVFELHFSKANDISIYLYRDRTNITNIARVKGVSPGDEINYSFYDSTSKVYTIDVGEYFIAKNSESYFVLGRILSIKDDTRGEANDEVCFAYHINTSKIGTFTAI